MIDTIDTTAHPTCVDVALRPVDAGPFPAISQDRLAGFSGEVIHNVVIARDCFCVSLLDRDESGAARSYRFYASVPIAVARWREAIKAAAEKFDVRVDGEALTFSSDTWDRARWDSKLNET